MSMPFGQPLSCHQYACNDVYRHHLSWQASSGKFIHVLAALWLAAVPFVCYYLPSSKCVRVGCWRAPTSIQEALPSSADNIDMQCLTHPFTDSSGSVPTFDANAPFSLRHPFSFVMILINFVDLIIFHFLFASCIHPGILCHLPSALLLPSSPFVLVHPLFWCVTSHFLPHVTIGCYSDVFTWGPNINTVAFLNLPGLLYFNEARS